MTIEFDRVRLPRNIGGYCRTHIFCTRCVRPGGYCGICPVPLEAKNKVEMMKGSLEDKFEKFVCNPRNICEV